MNLTWLRRRAAFGLWFEFFARAVAASSFILLAYVVAALFGFGSPWIFSAVLLLAAIAFGMSIKRLHRPAADDIDRRIERASGLRHRPIAMLDDAPENFSPISAALWQLHQRRIAASLQTARAGRPVIDAAARDPYALRGVLLLLLLTGIIIAGPDSLPRLGQALSLPSWPFAGPTVNAWITPPAYVGAPPLVLTPGDNPSVLAGSRLTVIVNGESRPAAALGGAAIHFSALAKQSFRADAGLSASAVLRVGPWWHRLASWDLTVLPPRPPQLSMSQPLPQDQVLRIGWHAQDAYGLAALSATLMPLGHARALPEVFSLSFASPDSKNPGGVAKPDIGASPYAGLPVTVTLMARNLADVTGTAGPMTVRLPPPAWQDKTATALAALRQRLALEPADGQVVGNALTALAAAPPSQISGSADLQMAVLARQLSRRRIAAGPAQEILLQLARQAEEGPDYAPARALAAVNQQLEQALRQAIASGRKLDDGRLQSLLSALHAALTRHMQALGPSAAGANAPSMNAGDIDRLAEQIAKDQAAGQTAKAAAELTRLEKILSALQSAKPMTAEQARRAAAANKGAQALASMMKGESTLLDQTNQGTATPGGQAALQQQLAGTRQALSNAGLSVPGLGNAADAMSAARNALAKQNTGTAATAEGGAIAGLQKAAAALAAAQGMSFGASGEQDEAGGDEGEGLNGAPDEDSTPSALPSSDNAAAAIQQQIIKNDDNPALPSAAHQYYHRLLEP